MAHVPLTELAQAFVRERLSNDAIAVDATVGNGHDTEFLARHVGAAGLVYGFDVQPIALGRTADRLAGVGLRDRVVLQLAGHERLARHLPAQLESGLGAAMFNLGYLPGAPRDVRTRPETTATALVDAWRFLGSGGAMTVLVYVGHDGGADELAVVERACDQWRSIGARVDVRRGVGEAAPVLFAAERTR